MSRHYNIAPATMQNVPLNMSAYTNHIINAIIDYRSKYGISQTQSFAPSFKGDSIYETCKNIFDFLHKDLTYELDQEGYQLIRTPSRLIKDGKGDCKSFSLLTSCILTNLGIPHAIRFIKDKLIKGPKEYTHVYVIAGTPHNYITIDAGNYSPTFNSEYDQIYGKPKDYWFCTNNATIGGYKPWKEFKAWVNRAVDNVGDAAKNNWESALEVAKELGFEDLFKHFRDVTMTSITWWDKKTWERVAHHYRDRLDDAGDYIRGDQDLLDAAKKKVEGVVHASKSLEPVLLAMRHAYIQLIMVNFRGWAYRFSYSRLSRDEAIANLLDPEEHAVANEAWRTVEKRWYRLGGNIKSLNDAVSKGVKNAPVFGYNKEKTTKISGEAVTAGWVVTASSIIGTMSTLVGMMVMTGIIDPNTDETLEIPPPLDKEGMTQEEKDTLVVAGSAAAAGLIILAAVKNKKRK